MPTQNHLELSFGATSGNGRRSSPLSSMGSKAQTQRISCVCTAACILTPPQGGEDGRLCVRRKRGRLGDDHGGHDWSGAACLFYSGSQNQGAALAVADRPTPERSAAPHANRRRTCKLQLLEDAPIGQPFALGPFCVLRQYLDIAAPLARSPHQPAQCRAPCCALS